MDELPPTVFRNYSVGIRPVTERKTWAETEKKTKIKEETESYWFVLDQLYQASVKHMSIGRERILAEARERYLPVSQKEVRDILTDMAREGLVSVGRGRGGSRLMPAGRELWERRQKSGYPKKPMSKKANEQKSQ